MVVGDKWDDVVGGERDKTTGVVGFGREQGSGGLG